VGRSRDAALGDDGADEPGRGDIERRIVGVDALGRPALAPEPPDLLGPAELDRDCRAVAAGKVDSGGGRGDVEGTPARSAARASPSVPTLLAVSPFAAMRSAPVITASTPFETRSSAAAESGSRVAGMPARASSQVVRRAPCRSGRVSVAKQRSTSPRSWPSRISASAVPRPPVASAPVLQWVSTRERGRSSSVPWAASAESVSRWRSSIARACPQRAARRSGSGKARARARERATALPRSTAVGRVALRAAAAAFSPSSEAAPALAAMAIPNAPAMPRSGAPRMRSSRIASQTESRVGRGT
jgi:hypothetical protein